MQKQGTVIRWDATRAFGFIRSPGTSADVFFHVRDFRGSGPPREGLAVQYEEIHVGGKGPRAMAVQPTAAEPWAASARPARDEPPRGRAAPHQQHQQHQRSHAGSTARAPRSPRRRRPREAAGSQASGSLALLLTFGWLALLAWGIWTRQLPLAPTLAAAVAVNAITFWAYAADKSAAINGRWRTAESHLHLLGLAGGWPAAWLAQQAMRHKSSKQDFRAVYWVTVVVHCAALVAWIAGVGR